LFGRGNLKVRSFPFLEAAIRFDREGKPAALRKLWSLDTLVFYTFHEDLNLETANHLTFLGHRKGKKNYYFLTDFRLDPSISHTYSLGIHITSLLRPRIDACVGKKSAQEICTTVYAVQYLAGEAM
jgi:hypothetical protein